MSYPALLHIFQRLTPRPAEVVAWLGRPRRGGCVLEFEIVERQNYRRCGNLKQQCVYGGSGWVGRPRRIVTLGSWNCGVQTAGNRDDTQTAAVLNEL